MSSPVTAVVTSGGGMGFLPQPCPHCMGSNTCKRLCLRYVTSQILFYTSVTGQWFYVQCLSHRLTQCPATRGHPLNKTGLCGEMGLNPKNGNWWVWPQMEHNLCPFDCYPFKDIFTGQCAKHSSKCWEHSRAWDLGSVVRGQSLQLVGKAVNTDLI